ncbi:MAG: hypothetical protein J6B16_04915 [Clostridia bacterium]|nr:hypothetical protein [Clostridia bacterium]
MKKFLFIILALLFSISTTVLIGCDFLGDDGNGGGNGGSNDLPQIDNSVDLDTFTPPVDDDNAYIDGETYYTSKSVSLVTEVNGNYTTGRPFTLDTTNENKRIYHNIYFYEEDFFQIIYYKNLNDLGVIYASLSDNLDQEYAEIEYTDKGTPLQINIIKQGIYDLVLDIQTLSIDMVKVGDIVTPVYETIKSCELYVHVSSSNYSYTPMTLDPTSNQYFIEAEIPLNASVAFYNASHTGRYKMKADYTISNVLVYYNGTYGKNPDGFYAHVGGRYKIYLDAKTYALKFELQNPDTATYFCQVGWEQGNVLTPVNSDTPYLFTYNFTAQGKPNDPYVDIPKFYPKLGLPYGLMVIAEDDIVASGQYIKEPGEYILTINLKEFRLYIEKA